MKLYNVFIKKTSAGKIEDVILVKEGFSFPAFLFSGLWFIYHKMWHELLIFAIINFLFAASGNFFSEFDRNFLQFALIIVIALNANSWLCEKLKRTNYEFIGAVFGDNENDAKLCFIKNFASNCSNDLSEFDDSILDPKFYHQMMKVKHSKRSLTI